MIYKFIISLVTIIIMAMPAFADEVNAVYRPEDHPVIEKAKKNIVNVTNTILEKARIKSPDPLPAVTHQNIAVIPVDISMTGDIQSIYTQTLGLISEDISNSLNKSGKLSSPHLKYLEDKIKNNKLEPLLNEFLQNYKNRYLVDYKSLQLIAEALEADKILLISGDFDTKQFIMKPNLAYELNVPEVSVLKPSYRIHTSATFIDPKKQIILWEKLFKKDFKVSNFDVPSISFANNIIPVNEIKKFSREISPKIVRNIFYTLPISRIQAVKSTTISTQGLTSKSKIKDGVTTTDGHSYSTHTKQLELERKQKYSEWVNENL